jgi:hypothetical protein
MNHRVRVRAQVEWTTDIEADSPEEAEAKAEEDFKESAWTNSFEVVAINEILATFTEEPE